MSLIQVFRMAQFKILPNTYIISPLTCFSKKRLFEEISALVSAITRIDEQSIFLALNEREAYGSTVCAKGIGLPHTILNNLDRSLAVLAILQSEIPYNTVDTDHTGVDMSLALFISPKDKYEDIEQMLSLISKELNNPDLANSFRRAWQDNSKLMKILQKLDSLLDKEINPVQKSTLLEEQD